MAFISAHWTGLLAVWFLLNALVVAVLWRFQPGERRRHLEDDAPTSTVRNRL